MNSEKAIHRVEVLVAYLNAFFRICMEISRKIIRNITQNFQKHSWGFIWVLPENKSRALLLYQPAQ